VIASRVGGIPEVISDRNGMLFPAGDIQALADALEQASGESWNPADVSQTVSGRSWAGVARQYIECINATIPEPPPDCQRSQN
jgi:glycosyltransferase involved in cell wall biosynthesis